MADRSPAAWLDLLEQQLHQRWEKWKIYNDYYDGNHRLQYVTRKFRATFGSLFSDLVDNWMPLIVDSPAERLRVQGFRFGRDISADDDAWDIWQANDLDAQSNLVHTESIKLGAAYWMVTPRPNALPRITCEHPSQVIVAHAPGDRRRRLAGLKKWREDGYAYANVYLPEGVAKFRSKEKLRVGGTQSNWVRVGSSPNPLGVVPIVEAPNSPTMLGGGRSDLAGGPISVQDALTKTLADMLIGSEYQALPQRVLLGVEPPRDPVTGKIIPDVAAMDSRLWYFNSDKAKAHEFQAANLDNFRNSIDGLIGDLASQTRTPAHYFKPQSISNLSAEALAGLETGLVSKVRDKQDPFGDAHEEMMRLAFRALDPSDPRAEEGHVETIWRDPEIRSQAQLVDAVQKKHAIGVPWEQCMEDLGYTPLQIDRMASMRETDVLLNGPEPQEPPAN